MRCIQNLIVDIASSHLLEYYSTTFPIKEFVQITFSGDLTDLQIVALRWRALAQQAKDESIPIHFKILFEALRDLDQQWDQDLLSNEEVRFLFLLFQKKKVHLTKNFKCCCFARVLNPYYYFVTRKWLGKDSSIWFEYIKHFFSFSKLRILVATQAFSCVYYFKQKCSSAIVLLFEYPLKLEKVTRGFIILVKCITNVMQCSQLNLLKSFMAS